MIARSAVVLTHALTLLLMVCAAGGGGAGIDVEDDLTLDDEVNNVFYIAVEHPLPLLPNVRAAYMHFGADAGARLVRDVSFAASGFVTSLRLRQGEAVLYY
ncbi:MAG: hypothetical protein QF921_04190 [Pseudomonadales bacterium]|jgi:hypothetical protein|nr:hypothetical protein [Pseudomonadales bacterium]MDP6471084.1 hypothetical protein [Pseudomonadales bacterium]MDP6825730.1 hypothetical protein [Pseudomonadales bacterium]MDP6970701.1 hypothetical protein [Pseudomonadales bacterium]|tara:strand:- start:1927 stop:2229 length:303 start_codon:yes stop_codon:yes gene_type:complete